MINLKVYFLQILAYFKNQYLTGCTFAHACNEKSATIKVPAKVRPDNSATVSLLPDAVLPAHQYICVIVYIIQQEL